MTTETGPEADALVGTLVAERYRIEAVLGHGGMGTVYRAEHVGMKKTVALKVLHPDIASIGDSAARFEREAVAAGRIDHPNVARAMDFGRLPDGSFYLVIEHIDGESLAELIQRGPLAPAEALGIARQIAAAVHAAHQVGVVHRDLKPANVMIAERGTSVKVLDFGVAKLVTHAAGENITRLGELVGTPEYMAPEQAGGGAVDQRADLYALGVIVYELLSGHPPFSGPDHVAIVAKHFVEPPPPLPESIPEATRSLVQALLEKEPEARIQTAAELISRIDEARAEIRAPVATAGEPIESSATPRTTARPSRPSRRVLVLAAASFVVLAVIAASVVQVLASSQATAVTSSLDLQASASAVSSLPAPVASALRAPATSADPATSAAASEADEAEQLEEPEAPEAPAAKPAAQTARTRSPRSIPTVTTTALPKGKRIIIRRRVIRRTTITSR